MLFWTSSLLRRLILRIVILCAGAALALAFYIGTLRGFDHTVGPDAWGRMVFGIGAAIMDQVFGIHGYVLSSSLESVLQSNGLTGEQEKLTRLGYIFPDNLRSAELVDRAIKEAVQYPYDLGPVRGASGDDVGFIDFVKIGFLMFGQNLRALFLAYFVLLGIEVFVFILAFRNRPNALALLMIVLAAHILLMGSSVLQFDGLGYGSVNNPKFLSVLGIVPAIHVALLVIYREPATLFGVAIVCIQGLLAALAIWIRSSALWIIIALFLLLVVSTSVELWRQGLRGWRSNLAAHWAIVVFFIVIAGHAAFVRHNLNPAYAQQHDLSNHNFWNLLLDQLQMHPDFHRKYGPLFGGAQGDDLPFVASRLYVERHPSQASIDDYFEDRLTLAAVEKYSRAVLFDLARQDPTFVAETFLYYNVLALVNTFRFHFTSLAYTPLLLFLLFVAVWTALITGPPNQASQSAVVAGIVSAGLAISLIPALISAEIADQFFVLLIVCGLWGMWALIIVAQSIEAIPKRLRIEDGRANRQN
jgi:hypothetical protein